MCRLLFVALSALAFMDIGRACKSAKVSIAPGSEAVMMWYCPPDQVLFAYENSNRCFSKCAECPNGFCFKDVCNCFPGTGKDKAGGCGKICKNCENGWCSSVSKCECEKDYTRINDQCVHASKNCPTDYLWNPPSKTCVPYESGMSFDINSRMET